MMRLGGASVTVVAETSLTGRVGLTLGDRLLTVGPYLDADGHERHLLSTVGGGDWARRGDDEFRFRPGDRRLASLWLKIPETPATEHPAAWPEVPRTSGTLALVSPERFTPPGGSSFWMADDGGHLGCFVEDPPGPGSAPVRLAVAEHLDLLFQEGEYAGWLLRDPEYHLNAGWGRSAAEAPDERLAGWLREYFDIVREPFTEAMEDEDPLVLARLRALLAEVDPSEGARSRRAVVRECVADLIDWFY